MGISQKEWVDFGRRSGLRCHRVSIGAMRLPADDDQAVSLVRQAIDAGMIYIDTSRGYGDSEIKVGKALKDGYREKVILSTKWSPWVAKIEEEDDSSAECTYKRIRESMERLDVTYLDFYQVWSIMKPEHYEQAIVKGGMLDGIRRAMDEGLVRHVGLTTHDTPENVSRYIDEADWCEAMLFTYNIMDQTYRDVIAKAHDRGIATIVMNPLAGGLLAEDSSVLKKAIPCDSLVELGHRYVAGDPNVDTILCGISKPSDIVNTLENYAKPPLPEHERRSVEEATAKLTKKAVGFCVGCGYCKPCPQGLEIPGIMHAVYLARLLEGPESGKSHYDWIASSEAQTTASYCTQCGECEERCTQKLNITEQMRYAAREFDGKDLPTPSQG